MKLIIAISSLFIIQLSTSAQYRYRGTVILPDSTVTPGAVDTKDTSIICHRKTTTVRLTTEKMKNTVYSEYGIKSHVLGQYEIDHLIPLELGGKDTVSNLWPQPSIPFPGFHQKDKLENLAHAMVCSGKLSVDSAQRWISHDWYSMFQTLIINRS